MYFWPSVALSISIWRRWQFCKKRQFWLILITRPPESRQEIGIKTDVDENFWQICDSGSLVRLAHRMPYFSVLGILKYGIGWRPQNAPFENCSIWEMFDLRIAPFEKCSIWEMFDLRIAPFEKCSIWEMFNLRNARFENCWIWETHNLRNMRMKTNHTFWEGCNFNQDGQI